MIFKSPVDQIKIDYTVYKSPNEQLRMFFLTGRAEYYRKYEELFDLITKQGITVYAMDHRGQGRSGRMLEDSQVGHVRKFSHYVDDAEFFLNEFVLKDKPKDVKVLSLSHSMGGAVSILLGLRCKCFDKMIFSSPMWGINTGRFAKVAFTVSKVLCLIGKGESYVVGTGPYDPEAFDRNVLTHSKEKYEKQKEYLDNNKEEILGGPSYRWLYESLKMCKELESTKLDLASEILLLQAQMEKVVDNASQDRIIRKIQNAKKVVVKDGFHELLNESHVIFDVVCSEIFSFLEK